ncbi:MAG: hypothetical protein WA655_12145 [Candidatus Korobacteraceae bacterium]
MNSKTWSKVLLAAILMALALPLALAQGTAKSGPKYDIANEVKVKGVIEDIRDVPGDLAGTNLAVKTDTKTILVYVGPGDFLKEIEVSFNKGDQIDVTGCRAPNTTEEVLLAREITVGSNTFTLRDDKGIPVWTGWKAPKSGK